MNRFVLLGLAALLCASAADAGKAPLKTLPSYLVLPPKVTLANGQDGLTQEDFGEDEFYNPGSDEPVLKKGKHWLAALIAGGSPDDAPGKAIWATLKPSFLQQGWTETVEYDSNPFSVMIRYQKDGKDTWGYMKIFGKDDIRFHIVEVGAPNLNLVAVPPAAVPEKFSAEKGDFPYLPALPGATFKSGSRDGGTMLVTLPGSEEEQLVGTGSIVKYYAPPPGLSMITFVAQYHSALIKTGWTIIEESAGTSQSDATLTAHYAKNGRNIWAYLHDGGEEYSIKVADAGAADDLAKQLAKNCHVALTGVLFDFNKATLKPDSDAVLQRVLAILQKDAALKVEVQGHTDNVGNDAYNQKLSEARAKSVVAWLTGHGIAADRLSFKGYGKTVPVASNDDDAGRAKNRRVEIAKPGCSGKH